jgi:phage replication initiation protein
MTRPNLSPLVLDGSEVKARLMAARSGSGAHVHVDWLRFTVPRRLVTPSADLLFPPVIAGNVWDEAPRLAQLRALMAELDGGEFSIAADAWQLGEDVCGALGDEFALYPEMRKGHDFYKHRWSVERAGKEVGWIGFGVSSESPRQRAQAKTLHVNLYGHACTFADLAWRDRMADVIEDHGGTVTRCDLALDFFEGITGGMSRICAEYSAGLMDSHGKRPIVNQIGDWINADARGRSFYIGSKEAGKQTNVYEKGDQLFGKEALSPWMRIELRYGNKLRDLPADMLRRPADFFAGASDWHAAMLREWEASDEATTPEAIRCRGRLPLETVDAEVARVCRWASQTAGATIAALWEHAGDSFIDFCAAPKLPGRLRSFSPQDIAAAFERRSHRIAHTVEGHSPTFA